MDGNPIYCHQVTTSPSNLILLKVILASRSLYFEALFTHDFKEKEQRIVNFSSEGISFEAFMLMLKHIYSDSLRVETKHIYELLSVRTLL